jgi:hypothetical protein
MRLWTQVSKTIFESGQKIILVSIRKSMKQITRVHAAMMLALVKFQEEV